MTGRGNEEYRLALKFYGLKSGKAIESRLFTRDNWNYRE